MSNADWSWKPDEADKPKEVKKKKPRKKKPKNKKKKGKKKGFRVYGDGFYMSKEWRELRYTFLKNQEARCACCGRTPRQHRIAIHVDHIKPRSKHPELELRMANLQILCEDCNLGKLNKDDTDWR